MMSLKKFSRGANYSEEEKTLLHSVLNGYLGVIESIKKDGATAKEKDRAWGMIAADYNGKSKTYRSKVSLKTCYENFKKAARKSQAGKTQVYKVDGGEVNMKPNALSKTVFLVMPGPARVNSATYNLNPLKDPDRVCTPTSPDDSDDVITIPQVEGPEYVIGDSNMPLEVLSGPDWSSYTVKRSNSPQSSSQPGRPPPRPLTPPAPLSQPARRDATCDASLSELKLQLLRDDAKRRKTQEDEDYRTRKLVEQEEADIRIQILKTELLIKREILKQEIKKTNAMDRLV